MQDWRGVAKLTALIRGLAQMLAPDQHVIQILNDHGR